MQHCIVNKIDSLISLVIVVSVLITRKAVKVIFLVPFVFQRMNSYAVAGLDPRTSRSWANQTTVLSPPFTCFVDEMVVPIFRGHALPALGPELLRHFWCF